MIALDIEALHRTGSREIGMQDHDPGRTADYRSAATRELACSSKTVNHDDTPRPSEVLYEIGIVMVAFLSVAILAQLLLLAIQLG